jgi:ABC-type multidrug transport system ATPase subunit
MLQNSMEESEALCTNLGIMVNGQFECFGNIQHLKHKYGKGYSLIIKCKTDLEQDQRQTDYYVNYIERFIQSNIPNAFLKDKQQQTLFYQIIVEDEQQLEVKKPEKVTSRDGNNNNQAAALSIAKIFTLIETNKEALNIETYSLSQTTLEQVFLSFARKQFNPNEFNMPVGNQPIGGTYIRYPSNRVNNNNGAVNRAFDGTDAATIVLEDMRV